MSEFLHWFPNEGFRPAKFANDYIGPRMDCPLIVKAEDQIYLAKFDPYAPLEGYAWGTWLPNASQEAVGAPLAGQTGVPATHTAKNREWASVWRPIEPWYPGPDYPCQCIEAPPEPAPVPIPASAGLLLLGLCIFAAIKRRKSHA